MVVSDVSRLMTRCMISFPLVRQGTSLPGRTSVSIRKICTDHKLPDFHEIL